MRALVIIGMMLVLTACAPAPMASAYNERVGAEEHKLCTTEICKPGTVRSFISLPPLYKAYLILTYPFWSA